MNFAEYIQDLESDSQAVPAQDEILGEKLVRKFVIRNGKRTWKWTTTRKGTYRVQIDKKTGQPKEVYITPMEKINRKKGQRKAAIKRKAKQKSISRLRKKAFHVRRNQGMRYNTGKSIVKKDTNSKDTQLKINHSLLRPDMMKEQLLLETPHVEILPDVFWDFFCEHDPAWLMQLVTLYKFKEMESVLKGGNEVEVLKVSDGELKAITKSLCRDIFFHIAARKDFNNLTDVEQEQFLSVVPDDLLKILFN